MMTLPKIVEEIVKKSPFLEEGLSLGIVNLSALARKFKPQIQERLLKDITSGAIVMALKRLEANLKNKKFPLKPVLDALGDITVRSNICEYTFENSSSLLKNQIQLLLRITEQKNTFLTITDGVFETTIFASQNLKPLIEEVYKEEKLKTKQENLSSITIVIPEEATYVPGVYYSILKKLAWEGINFIEVVSSYTELTIFLEAKNVERAFSALKS